MKKVLILTLLGIIAASANAQLCQGYGEVKDSTASRFRGQFDFYVQDCWGIGLTLRKESSKYFGWNLIGVSYMSGWYRYETPDKLGIVNVRTAGVRFNVPIYKNFKFYAEATPGYTFMYAKSLEGLGYGRYFWRSTETAHCFGLDCSAGFQVIKDVTLGYNFSFFANGNGNSHIHWGRISIIF
ncbi:MAG: hypothetical protein IJR69_09835 [Bacteroidaceae bacterium]|nr:hypothetical protein [Bacteroidaceae bacterium]